jgi:hypothetical protein
MTEPLRLRDRHPVPSAQDIPTLHSTAQATKRNASYTSLATLSPEKSGSKSSCCKPVDELRHYDQELKAGLTQLLNEGRPNRTCKVGGSCRISWWKLNENWGSNTRSLLRVVDWVRCRLLSWYDSKMFNLLMLDKDRPRRLEWYPGEDLLQSMD